jgi:nucleotide-binding universal stress UspA family protein
MSPHAIVSYDDTLNDHDALAFARILASAGANLTLAYVRHTNQLQQAREQLEEKDADALLARGSRWLGDLEVERRVVVDASTGRGLRHLAEAEHADVIVFGSDYRTAAGHISPQQSTQSLLEDGPAAVAIAPANYRAQQDPQIHTIGLLAGLDDHAAIDTAHSLATHFDAAVSDAIHGADLLIVGSRPEAKQGRVMLSSHAQNTLENATCPVLAVARGVAVNFRSPLYVS